VTAFLGIDNGQASDPAAWCLCERRAFVRKGTDPRMRTAEQLITYASLHATAYSRWPLRTPYTEIVRKVASIVQIPDWYGDITVIVDCTRERAVYDIMRETPGMYGATIIPIVITGGNHVSVDAYGWYMVPESDLLSDLTVGLEGERVKASREGGQGEGDAEELNRQLENIKRRVSARRRVVGMSTDGSDVPHDDMAFSLAFAVWYATYIGALAGPKVHHPDEVKPYNPATFGLTGE
jgi:hypothetical protein